MTASTAYNSFVYDIFFINVKIVSDSYDHLKQLIFWGRHDVAVDQIASITTNERICIPKISKANFIIELKGLNFIRKTFFFIKPN